MSFDFFLKAPIGLLPVLIFLAVLLHLDTFRMVSLYIILRVMAAGGFLAAASYILNDQAMAATGIPFADYSRYVAPVLEETLKAGVIVYLFVRNRIGFMVDAAILGLAVGAGFALVENIYQLYVFHDANLGVWIVRGFGTAIMHGGATAIFGVVAQSMTERHSQFNVALYLPGLLLAIVLHSAFNHFPGSPIIAAAAALIVLPLILFFVFAKSEHKIHDWLLHDYETHEHLLEEIRSGAFTHSEAGRFMTDLAARFEPAVVADMFSYIQLHTELVLRAEKVLLAREKGEKVPFEQADREHFDTLHALERKIGRTGLLALWPHLHFSRQELCELYELEDRTKHATIGSFL